MGILGRSLSEDKVDHCNRTWSVMFLLVLAIVTWLLPLSPNLQLQNQPASPAVIPQVQVTPPKPVPRFKASCWCPNQFNPSMVAYSAATCGRAYNLAMQGVDLENQTEAAVLYRIGFDEPIPKKGEGIRFKPNVDKSSLQRSQVKLELPRVKDNKQSEKIIIDNARYFIHTKTPFALFLLAICLTTPHLVWTLLSTLVGGISVDQTLSSARVGTGLSCDSRKQLHRELACATAEKTRACSWTASSLYLLLKILMCLAVIAELLVVHKILLPQAQSLEGDLTPKDLNGDVMESLDAALNTLENTLTDNTAETYVQTSETFLLCELPIRQLSNVQTYLLQCTFQAETEDVPQEPTRQDTTPKDDQVAQTPDGVMTMYVTVFLVVQAFLALLTVVNVSSFLVWLLKLVVKPCRLAVSCDRDLPIDACLLLYMAQENAGPEVVKAFSQAEVWGEEEEKEEEKEIEV